MKTKETLFLLQIENKVAIENDWVSQKKKPTKLTSGMCAQ